jgi:hypothetical protein
VTGLSLLAGPQDRNAGMKMALAQDVLLIVVRHHAQATSQARHPIHCWLLAIIKRFITTPVFGSITLFFI